VRFVDEAKGDMAELDQRDAISLGEPYNDGKIKKDEVRNPWGAKGKPKEPMPPQSPTDALIEALLQPVSVTRRGETTEQPAHKVLAESIVAAAIKSPKVSDKIAVMKYLERRGIPSELTPPPPVSEGPWTQEIEKDIVEYRSNISSKNTEQSE